MRVLSAEEVTAWFRGFENLENPEDYVHADEDGLYFTHPEAACIDLEYPAKLERLPFFSRCVATIGYEDKHFNGALIWIQGWGVRHRTVLPTHKPRFARDDRYANRRFSQAYISRVART